MSIDKVIAKELQYRYLDRIETALKERGLTFTDLKIVQKLEVVSLVNPILVLRAISEMVPNYQYIKTYVYAVMK